MKIFNVKKIRELDEQTVKERKIASIDLMEMAAIAFVEWLVGTYDNKREVLVFCGLGNNGGDGLAITRILNERGFKAKAYVVEHSKQTSEDFSINENKLSEKELRYIREAEVLPPIGKKDLVIDAIFGSGLSRPIDSGLVMAVIEHINGSGAEVVAVDIPSGLFADKPSTAGAIVKARHTVSFQLPKLAFMLSENHPFVGDWHLVPIGLSKKAIKKAEAGAFYITEKDIRKILKPRDKFSHKGTFGHALLLAGSYGKIGAALLAAKACLRSGAGLLTAHLPACGYPIMQIACPEAMVSTDKEEKFLSALPEDLQGKNAIGIGPGLGLSESSAALLLQLFQAQPETPMVIDADALNLMAKYRQLLDLLPSNSILTPHPKEFERLVGGKPSGDFERLKWQAAFASQYGVYVVCKGAHTSIASPDGEIFFNSTGNAGMATAGSGDVLTGVLLGLLAQGYMPREAALLGVFIHGLAGDVAKAKHGETSLIASDIIEALGGAFSKVERPENNTPNNEKAGKQVNGESKIKNM